MLKYYVYAFRNKKNKMNYSQKSCIELPGHAVGK